MPTSASNSAPSYFEEMTGKAISPVWLLRVFTIVSIVPLLLALFVFTTGGRHDFCIGLSVGTLIGLLVQTFAISNVDLRNAPRPSEVQDVRITQ
jgi:hypothetical protein